MKIPVLEQSAKDRTTGTGGTSAAARCWWRGGVDHTVQGALGGISLRDHGGGDMAVHVRQNERLLLYGIYTLIRNGRRKTHKRAYSL